MTGARWTGCREMRGAPRRSALSTVFFPTSVAVSAQGPARCIMLLVVHRTFLTLVPDDSLDPPFARARSAPPALHYADSARRDVVASRRHSKPRKKKQAGGHGAAEDSDDSWYEEYTAIVAQEVAELPPEQPNNAATEPKRTKRRCRGGVRSRCRKGKGGNG